VDKKIPKHNTEKRLVERGKKIVSHLEHVHVAFEEGDHFLGLHLHPSL
jgi:hypothetical protein